MKALLILQDGTRFQGTSFGSETGTAGEVVFNTGMVGYPETLTDPSYTGQVLVLTYPLIGNYGVPDSSKRDDLLEYFESSKIHIKGLIVGDYSMHFSHWNGVASLAQWLKREGIPALTGIDTRALTKKLREQGTMLGKIVFDKDVELYDPNNHNLTLEVSCKEMKVYGSGKKQVVLVDCGTKNGIIRSLLQRDVRVLLVPYTASLARLKYDGICISNGPGDPKMVPQVIDQIKYAYREKKPILGICLGNQLMALAAGANTYKLKYGHRSHNQPCILRGSKRCYITSQNHGFAVDAKTLADDWSEWFVNANDGTNEGIMHRKKPFFAVQFHPEATPGPVDTGFIFDKFVKML